MVQGANVYSKILIPITRTSNMKFLVDFVNHFLKPGGEITFLHIIASDLFTISPAEWRRAMSTISTTHLLSATEGMRVDYKVKKSLSVASGILDEAESGKYDLILLHFQNWQQPGPGERARENLRQLVEGGKGVALVHFACGAWFGEWPEFVKLAGRAWFGSNPGAGKRQHDPYGPFRVELAKREHPIVRGMTDFDTQDELSTCLVGDYPIEILAQAKSKVDGKYYPMAFVSHYGKGRTFHCVFGHDTKSLGTPAVQELYRRGCAWAAGLESVPSTGAQPANK